MCGIIGIAGRSPLPDRGILVSGRDAQSHRGPDAVGEWWSPDCRVGLGHRRLAIIDLSPGGRQPMLDPSGDLVIVFNGEIYNYVDLRQELLAKGHTFNNVSDTAVILAAYREWGVDCLRHINGMFALALFDSRTQRLFLARDRAGEKPLFYSVLDGSLRFASELKALLVDSRFPRRIDSDALDCYLAMGYVPGDRCILRGVRKLPPAHALTYDIQTGDSKVWRYWQLPDYTGPAGGEGSDLELLDELEGLLEDAVRRQMVADVPVGILLSGGVDSSLITAMAVRAAANVRTFTIRFPGHGRYDESAHARLIAGHFKTEHAELDAAEASADLLPMLARQFDEPIVDSSMIPTFLVSKLIRQHCTVALGGDGGDELFAGYGHYDRLLWLQHRLAWVPKALRNVVSRSAEGLLPVGVKGRNWLQGLGGELETGLPLIATYFDASSRRRLMTPTHHWSIQAERIREERIPRSGDILQRATRMDFENYLAEDILVKVDRASMLNSLEVRAPLLDFRVIEFAFGRVPSRLKATGTERKILLKRLCSRVLPSGFDMQRKQGFSIPLGSWLSGGPWRDLFQDVLLGDDDALFNRDFLQQLFDGQGKGRANSERLFALTVLELWRKEYQVSLD